MQNGGNRMNLEKLFHLKENHTDVKTEVIAGITTFMTMAYILAVNPNILSAAGMDSSIYRDGSGVPDRYASDGAFVELPVRTGARHGLERLLCIYGRFADGIFMADGSGGSIRRRYCIYPAVFDKCARSYF